MDRETFFEKNVLAFEIPMREIGKEKYQNLNEIYKISKLKVFYKSE